MQTATAEAVCTRSLLVKVTNKQVTKAHVLAGAW